VVNETQAETVRLIFAKYLELGSVHDLKPWLEEGKFLSKAWTSAKGRQVGGLVFNRGALFHLLRNRVYLGEITHKGQTYPGPHAPIVDADLFAKVQEKLSSQARRHNARPTRVSTMALKGLIFDADGEPMSPTFTHGAKGRVYRYYVSSPLQKGTRRNPGDEAMRRVPAGAIEALVVGSLERLAGGLGKSLASPLARVEVHPTTVQMVVRREAFFRRASDATSEIETLSGRLLPTEHITPEQGDETLVRVTLPCRLKSQGGRVRILDQAGKAHAKGAHPDAALIRGLRGAHAYLAASPRGPSAKPENLAIAGIPKIPYQRKLCALAFLAPVNRRPRLTPDRRAMLTPWRRRLQSPGGVARSRLAERSA
jgi:site-specific DNA recombinase